jgi:hypothetical protein
MEASSWSAPARPVRRLRIGSRGRGLSRLADRRDSSRQAVWGGLTMRAVRQLPFSVEPVVEDRTTSVRLRPTRAAERHTQEPLVLTQRGRLDRFLAGEPLRPEPAPAASGQELATRRQRPRA